MCCVVNYNLGRPCSNHPCACLYKLVNWLTTVSLLLSYSFCPGPVKECLCSCRWAVNQTHCSIKAQPRLRLLFPIETMYGSDPERMNHTPLQKRLPLKLILQSQNAHHSIPWQSYSLTQTSNICLGLFSICTHDCVCVHGRCVRTLIDVCAAVCECERACFECRKR